MKREKNGDFKFLKKRIVTGLLLGTAMLIPLMPSVYALPSEGAYSSTNASTVTTNGNIMDITGTKENNVLNWNTFSIASEETVNFTDSNNYLNLVNGINQSTIDGALNGDGNIYLVNPNGIIFGSNATINVGGLIASTRDITTNNITDFENGKNPITNSTVDSLSGNIMNLGNIQANSIVLEGNEVIIQNAANVSSSNVTIKALDDITVGHKVENQIDLDETIGTTNNAADYANATISSSGYTGTDLAGEQKDITEAFLVEDVYDLQNMNANLTANYLLASDIDASDTSNWIDGFTPVGSENTTESYWQWEEWYTFWGKTVYHLVEHTTTTINTFDGSFNGAGNVINGLTINQSEDNVGLFGYVDNASIKNVGLKNSSITGYDNVGGIIGYVDGDTTISNLFNLASVSGNDNVGGVIGFVDEDIELAYLFNAGSVNGDDNVGGLVGAVDSDLAISTSLNLGSVSGDDSVGGLVGSVDGDVTLSNLFNSGSVSGDDSVGGAVGSIDGDTTISNLFNYANVSGDDSVGGAVGSIDGDTTITNSFNLGSISGDNSVGGLVGGVYSALFNDSNITISNSYNSGNISANESNLVSESNVGGLVGGIYSGLLNDSNITISNSYNTGDVSFSVDNLLSQSNVGGLVGGLVGNGDITISNSYNTGSVSSNESNLLGESNLGGLVGGLVGVGTITVDNSYYATTDTNDNEINQDSNDYGNAKTYSEMLQASTYSFSDDIDIIGGQDTVWRMYEGYTTPLLKSFMQTVEIIDPTSIYNGEEQMGLVYTLDGTQLSSFIYGNVGTNSGVYTLYSSQLGYDLVNSTGIATPVYTIRSLESLVEGKKEDYNTVIGVSKMKTFIRPTFEMGQQQKGLKKEAQIINNSKPLLGADETFYDNENDSVVIFNN